jgi:two-component sensor histidine kinase
VVLELANDGHMLVVRVTDDGVGLPADFDLDNTSGLGLSIVQTLVTTELQGRITMQPRAMGAHGAVAEIVVPLVADEVRVSP